MWTRKSSIAVASLALMLGASQAYAFGNACKNVNFSVDSNFTQGDGVTVTSVELWSQSEGRWLYNDFKNVFVPNGARDFVVRKGENVEYAENDRITAIKYNYKYDQLIEGKSKTVHASSTDPSITDQVCVADRWYKGTINVAPDAS
jgi:hypothetical protein